MGKKSVIKEDGFFSTLFGKFMPESLQRSSMDKVLFEGNKLINIDPYRFLPDPNVSIHDIQKGEFVGWVDSDNVMSLLSQEQHDDTYFNVQYLKHLGAKGSYFSSDDTNRSERYGNPTIANSSITHPCNVVYMYVNIIPSEYGLGASDYPEKWMFGVAAEEIVIKAQPLGLNHNMYPTCVCAPGFDGYSMTPVAELELTYGMQELIDWLFSSHIHNIRKSLHEMFIVDPSLINMYDLKKPGPGKFLRLRRSAWGSQKIDSAIKQLQVNDITRNNVGDAGVMLDLMNRVLGTSDSLQGVMRHTSERKSATEARGAHSGAITRLEKSARIASMMAMHDISYMFASHTQQFMTDDIYVQTVGLHEEALRKEYGIKSHVKVSPKDINIDYDVICRDGSVPSGDFAESWIQLFQIAMSNPEMAQSFDLVRMFKHIARITGAKNVGEFVKKGGGAEVSTMPDEQVASQVQQGNLVSVEDFSG